MRPDVPLPRGYARADDPRGTVVAREDVVGGILAALRGAPATAPTVHGFAREVPGARALHGREAAYAIPLPQAGMRVVVRHNRHGGALRAITGDLFRSPTRAPLELERSLRLKALGVPTPPVVAYAIYPAAAGLARSDVVTEEIPDSEDFGALLLRTTPEDEDRRLGWNALRRLLKRLAAAGARHHDLNVKNVLLRRSYDGLFDAHVLDVDRVELDCARRDAYAGNRARLRRSVEKWRDTRGARITAAEIDTLRRRATSTP